MDGGEGVCEQTPLSSRSPGLTGDRRHHPRPPLGTLFDLWLLRSQPETPRAVSSSKSLRKGAVPIEQGLVRVVFPEASVWVNFSVPGGCFLSQPQDTGPRVFPSAPAPHPLPKMPLSRGPKGRQLLWGQLVCLPCSPFTHDYVPPKCLLLRTDAIGEGAAAGSRMSEPDVSQFQLRLQHADRPAAKGMRWPHLPGCSVPPK